MLANMSGRPVHRSRDHCASAIGAALCGAAAIDRFANLDMAAESRAAHAEIVYPDERAADSYEALYARWTRWRAASSETDRISSELTMPFALSARAMDEPS
jgi:sugar (pentulose or hexulose) kinase